VKAERRVVCLVGLTVEHSVVVKVVKWDADTAATKDDLTADHWDVSKAGPMDGHLVVLTAPHWVVRLAGKNEIQQVVWWVGWWGLCLAAKWVSKLVDLKVA
jgi:hypothetical protein